MQQSNPTQQTLTAEPLQFHEFDPEKSKGQSTQGKKARNFWVPSESELNKYKHLPAAEVAKVLHMSKTKIVYLRKRYRDEAEARKQDQMQKENERLNGAGMVQQAAQPKMMILIPKSNGTFVQRPAPYNVMYRQENQNYIERENDENDDDGTQSQRNPRSLYYSLKARSKKSFFPVSLGMKSEASSCETPAEFNFGYEMQLSPINVNAVAGFAQDQPQFLPCFDSILNTPVKLLNKVPADWI